jgi:hypothetical protein
MQYLITIPDTPQSIALINFMKSSGLVSKVKAIKNQDELNGVQTKEDLYEVPARTDTELREMMKYSNHGFKKEYLHNDSNIF